MEKLTFWKSLIPGLFSLMVPRSSFRILAHLLVVSTVQHQDVVLELGVQQVRLARGLRRKELQLLFLD